MTKEKVTQRVHSRAGTSTTVTATLTVTHTMFTTNQAISDARVRSRHRQLLRWGHYAPLQGNKAQRAQPASGRADPRPAGRSLPGCPCASGRDEQRPGGSHSRANSPGAPSRRGPTARRPRFRENGGRGGTKPPPPAAGRSRAPEGLAAALGLRTAVGLARFIPAPSPRCPALLTRHREKTTLIHSLL